MRLILKTLLLFIPFILVSSIIDKTTQSSFNSKRLASPIELIESQWVDSILNSMSLKEKVGQLFMIPVYSNQNSAYENKLIDKIKRYNIGGMILMKGTPYRHVNLTNRLQENSKIPLMVAIDGEWGIAMRIDSIHEFPKAMTLGAIKNEQLIFDLGQTIAQQCQRMGIHINFGPVLDVNTNFNNPIINMRAFGDNRNNVARKGLAYAIGMQSKGVLAVGKHFPGHGRTFTDSHKTLPKVFASKEQLYEEDLFPFENLIQNELGGMMIAHIAYPALDARLNRPASLSSIIIDSILKKELGFKGLIFTDALNMKGVTKNFRSGEIEVEALLAGNDVLLYSEDIEKGISSVISAIEAGVLAEEDINNKCLKILKAKQWFGLDNYKPVDTTFLIKEINTPEAQLLTQKLTEESITLIKNKTDLLPLSKLEDKKLLCISLGEKHHTTFQEYLANYSRVDTISCSRWVSNHDITKILDTVKYYTHVIIGFHDVSEWPFSRFKLSNSNIKIAEDVASLKPTVLSFFGNPYALKYFSNKSDFQAILIAYNNTSLAQKYAAQSIFAGIRVEGVLPIGLNENYPSGTGYAYTASRLKYTEPNEFNLPDTVFYQVDSIVLDAIAKKAMPGCQVFYAKNGNVIYNKYFGHETYRKSAEIEFGSVYDIASVTKLAATTICLMKMYEMNQFDPAAKLSQYMEELKHTDKKSIRINQILAHHSGLHSWIPFYRETLVDGNLRSDLYAIDSSEQYSIKVADKLFLRNDYADSIFQTILDTPLYHKKKYRYSDLGYYWMAKLIEKQTGQRVDHLASANFYKPLGMNYTTFNAWKYAKTLNSVPSENDKVYRKQEIVGYVHDPGAAMLGGVSGHAGLFSNANDLGKLGQMLLNKGNYGGDLYFLAKTLDVFNKSYFKRKDNRRALGFDKPALKKGDPGPTCESASQSSFGHSGFTGTYLWIDPEAKSVFVFLSNRTYPDQENKKLVEMNVRTNIQQVFYNVFEH